VSGFPGAAGLEGVVNPEVVALALRRIDAGLRAHIEPGRFPGATVLVPLGPAGRPVVTESFRTVPVFSDMEALTAWAAPPTGFPPDAELEPVVAGVRTAVMPDGIDDLLAGGGWVVVLNPAGPGASHLAGVVGEAPLRPEDLQGPPVERGFLGRSRHSVDQDDPRVRLDQRSQLRHKVAISLDRGVAARDAGNVAQALQWLKQADTDARRAGDHVSSVTATLHAARLLVEQGEGAQGAGLADLTGMGSNRHAKPRLQLEGLLISAERLERSVKDGRAVAAGAAAWTADWLRRLAAVAVEQGSMSAARQDGIGQIAEKVAATYNDPLDNYDPAAWTPERWSGAWGGGAG
jgi:hypothetical protein